jgi:hypothetical protein
MPVGCPGKQDWKRYILAVLGSLIGKGNPESRR